MENTLVNDALVACKQGVDAASWEASLASVPQPVLQDLLGSVVVAWCEDPLSAHRGSMEMAQLLIKHGANPLSGPAPVLSSGLCADHPDIAVHLVNLLCRLQTNCGIVHQTDAGGNALHALVKHSPDWLGAMLSSAFDKSRFQVTQMQTMSLPTYAHLHPQWLAQPQHDGSTPLHLWWRQAPELYDFYDRDDLAAFKVWDTFTYLARAGAPLDAVDAAGVSVAGLLVQAVDDGIDPASSEEWVSMARSIHQDLTLQSKTALVAHKSKGPRL